MSRNAHHILKKKMDENRDNLEKAIWTSVRQYHSTINTTVIWNILSSYLIELYGIQSSTADTMHIATKPYLILWLWAHASAAEQTCKVSAIPGFKRKIPRRGNKKRKMSQEASSVFKIEVNLNAAHSLPSEIKLTAGTKRVLPYCLGTV